MGAIDFQNGLHLLGISLLGCVVLVVAACILASDSEAAVLYDVPIPEPCTPGWKGKVLEEPGLKVCIQQIVKLF